MKKQTYGITGMGLACITLCNALLLIVECCFCSSNEQSVISSQSVNFGNFLSVVYFVWTHCCFNNLRCLPVCVLQNQWHALCGTSIENSQCHCYTGGLFLPIISTIDCQTITFVHCTVFLVFRVNAHVCLMFISRLLICVNCVGAVERDTRRRSWVDVSTTSLGAGAAEKVTSIVTRRWQF